ncbi:ETEC_3214 domain-containing protein [Arsenicicoccus bolidensis]|uniref:Uncharacterized protein n=1 Tax=Arsenicicoccus bolidensis TaxID=229480 RepID=A0ABS9Q0F2_9MICO|nr:ETEC_3214 domain-containing protein [Arsenicicoccus bolidensis]MCG7321356.1 hypothetical protein [Arsenicicoccus bolidensis]
MSALVGAVLVIADAAPRAYSVLQWRDVEYQKLRSIHAGYDQEFATNQFGPATITQVRDNEKFVERIYVRRDHFVQIVTDRDSGRIALYSVVSCESNFRPAFDADEGVVVVLQDLPLSRAASFNPETVFPAETVIEEPSLNSGRSLHYLAGNTSSTPEHYVESWPLSMASKNRAYFVGASALCLGVYQGGSSFVGHLEDAPADVKKFRDTIVASLYAESTEGGDLDNEGYLKELGAPIGVSSWDLPPSIAEPAHAD